MRKVLSSDRMMVRVKDRVKLLVVIIVIIKVIRVKFRRRFTYTSVCPRILSKAAKRQLFDSG